MNLLSSLLTYTARQLGYLKVKANELNETKSRVTTVEMRVDNFVSTIKPDSVETLWTGSAGKNGDTITLAKSSGNFDYLDIYTGTVDTNFQRVPVSRGYAQIQTRNMADSSDLDFVDFYETGLNFTGNTLTISHTTRMHWNGSLTDAPQFFHDDTSYYIEIKRIDGVKIGSNEPAELVDMRVGDDNVTYSSAGVATRAQFAGVKNSFANYRSALVDGNNISLMNEITLVDGEIWTGSVGQAIGTGSWAGAGVRSSKLMSFGDVEAIITTANDTQVKYFEVDTDGITIRRASDWLVNSATITFSSLYTYSFTFRKTSSWQSHTSQDVRANVHMDTSTALAKLMRRKTVDQSRVVRGNLFDKNNVIKYHYFAGDNETPTLSNKNNSYHCQLVEIPNDESYYILNYKDLQIDSFDSEKHRIRTEYFTAGSPRKVASGTKYLTISLTTSHVKDFMLVEGDTLPSSYVGYGDEFYYDEPVHEYHVGINDPDNDIFYPDGDNITALLKKLENDDSEKTIYIHAGTYNIFNEYGGTSYINSLTGEETWSEVSVFVPPNTKIIGVGTVKLEFKPTAEQIINDHNAQLFSILNVKHEVYIENLILDGMNCRYCIHDETSGVGDKRGANHTYKNVICIKTQDTYGNGQCFGGGFTDPLNYDFINCKMTSWSIPFSIHNGTSAYYNKGAVINVKDSYFDSTVSSVSMSFRNNTSQPHRNIVNIDGSYVGGMWANLEVTAQGNTTYPNTFDVTLNNCNYIIGSEVVTPTNAYHIKQINVTDLYRKGVTEIKPSWVSGYFLSGNSSTYNANANFKYSTPFYVKSHCTLKIFAKGYNTIVNILSKTSAKGGYYKEVKRCIDSSAMWYSVDIDEAGYYIVCSSVVAEPLIFVTDIDDSPNENILAMFNKLICCGDSLTYGLVYTSSSTYRQAIVPYNEALQKMTGVPTVRYATAGYTAKDWWNANNSHLNEDGLYIIFLGTNGGLTDTINTDCVGDDPSQFADTQTGYYGRILRTLEINKKTAVLIKPPAGNAETQGTIQKFADKYGFAAISLPPELENNYYHYAPHNLNYSNGIHYNDMGYVHIANCIMDSINKLPLRELFLIAPYEA